MSAAAVLSSSQASRQWPVYRAIWRWHFYAGLLCVPFIIWLSLTGGLYLFKPQIEALIDRPYDHLSLRGAPAPADAQIAAALAAVPGSEFAAYEVPKARDSAVRVLVKRDGIRYRVYLHPQDLSVLKQVREDRRLMRVISSLHGELMAGDVGSILVELAASWAVVMIISGLYLWWPRGGRIAGVLYPRLGESRRFWRDLHAVTGFWVSAFALFLLASGLPWASVWGSNLKTLRELGARAEVRQDWSTRKNAPASTEHDHGGHDHSVKPALPQGEIDRVLAVAASQALAAPVLITPPAEAGAAWTLKSDAQNRPLRVELSVDGRSGAILQRKAFSQRALLDRIIGTGIAAHEGQLFGWLNQLLGLLTALGLITLASSAALMWWRRRPVSRLGALPAAPPSPFAYSFFALVAVLAVVLPVLGISLLLVLLIERLLLRRLPRASLFLGLRAAV